MSQRTIIEINHDCGKIDPGDFARFCALWNVAIGSGAKENWGDLEKWGIRRVTQCHHSEDRKLVVGAGSLTREHVIG